VQKEFHVLHLLGVSVAKLKPAGSKKGTKQQMKDKTKISNVLTATVGLTLQTKRASGCKRRKAPDAENCYTLAVAKPVQEIIDLPSELVAEHWYRRKYNQEPPHLDRLYTGDVPLTDELRAVLEKRQQEEDECSRQQEDAELAAAMEHRLQHHNLHPAASVVPEVKQPVVTEQERQEQEQKALAMWMRITSKPSVAATVAA
jgi:hypothetical protein